MRILHVIHGLRRGGLENGVVNVANGLPRAEFEQGVCCLDQRGEMADRLVPRVPVWVLDRGRHDLRVPVRLARLIREWRPDVVHCRNWNTWPDAVVAHQMASRRQRLVWSFHGFADGHWLPTRRRMASRLLARFTDNLFAVCRDSAERYAALSGIDPRRFDVVYNGVDTARFRPAEDRDALRRGLGFSDGELVVLTVASLTPVKDHAGLIAAVSRLARQAPNPFRLLLVGEGPLRAALDRQVAELALTRHVDIPGASDHVPDLMAAADVFVLPSRLEGMSNAILEAMASGLPVVANAVGGNPELVVDGQTGFLCRPGDPMDLAAAIGRLLANADRRRRMGDAARARAVSVFSIEAMLHGYADYYRRVAQS